MFSSYQAPLGQNTVFTNMWQIKGVMLIINIMLVFWNYFAHVSGVRCTKIPQHARIRSGMAINSNSIYEHEKYIPKEPNVIFITTMQQPLCS